MNSVQPKLDLIVLNPKEEQGRSKVLDKMTEKVLTIQDKGAGALINPLGKEVLAGGMVEETKAVIRPEPKITAQLVSESLVQMTYSNTVMGPAEKVTVQAVQPARPKAEKTRKADK
ncbi:Uncharacterised protein [uncultured archaeon]|nr:Uncharacterised protein [uncultured archaeon]